MELFQRTREYELSVLVAAITNATVIREHNLGIIHEKFATARVTACENYNDAILDIEFCEASAETNRLHALDKRESEQLAKEFAAKISGIEHRVYTDEMYAADKARGFPQ